MLAMTKEILVSLSDVDAFVVECKQCHSQLRFNPELEWKEDVDRDSPFVSCPLCHAPFDSTLKIGLLNLRNNWRGLTRHSNVSLQVNADALPSITKDVNTLGR